MKYKAFFNKIEEYYFKNDFKGLVDYWESKGNEILIDYSKVHDAKILEAVRTSYMKLGYLDKSMECLVQQIKLLPKLDGSPSEKMNKLNYYLISKMSLLMKMKKHLLYYKTLHEYVSLFGDTLYEERALEIEKIYYKKFLFINKVFIFSILGLVVLDLSAKLFSHPINPTVQLLYEVLTWSGLVWVVFLALFYKKIGYWFVKLFRLVFKPRRQNGDIFKIT